MRRRLKTGWLLVVITSWLILAQLFSLQILRSDHYRDWADATQTKSYQIEAPRGLIYAKNGSDYVPLVLNERRWLVFADGQFVTDSQAIIEVLTANGLKLSAAVRKQLEGQSRYIVLGRQLTDQQKQAIEAADVKGIYFQKQSIRAYTEGRLAADVLGFLNNDSVGQYGVEQFYHDQLSGQPGFVKALTDVRGVPLTIDENNIRIAEQPGDSIYLTIDIPLQRYAERVLAETIARTESKNGRLLVLDADSGAVLALADWPGFDPARSATTDTSLFLNSVISHVVEPGSTAKTFTMAAALDQGVVGVDDSYDNPASWWIEGHNIGNFVKVPAGRQSMTDILLRSLNTGSVWLLQQLGGGQFNQAGRQQLYDYLTGSFLLGSATGIDLPGEVGGRVYKPDEGHGRQIRYANMTFGQGMTSTILQLAAAFGAIFNGGTYYQPYVVGQIGDQVVEPTVVKDNILQPGTIAALRLLFDRVGQQFYLYDDLQLPGLKVNAKTGSSQLVKPTGGYYDDLAAGLIVGQVTSHKRTLIIAAQVQEPQVTFAGSQGAGPIFRQLATYLINSGKVVND